MNEIFINGRKIITSCIINGNSINYSLRLQDADLISQIDEINADINEKSKEYYKTKPFKRIIGHIILYEQNDD